MKKIGKKSKRRLVLFVPLSILAIVYFFMTLATCLFNFTSLKLEQNKLKNELVSIQEQKSNLKQEIIKLNDPNYIARYAKEKYLYSANGEYVIKLDGADSKASSSNENINNNIYIIIIICLLFLTLLLISHIKNKHKKKTLKRSKA